MAEPTPDESDPVVVDDEVDVEVCAVAEPAPDGSALTVEEDDVDVWAVDPPEAGGVALGDGVAVGVAVGDDAGEVAVDVVLV